MIEAAGRVDGAICGDAILPGYDVIFLPMAGGRVDSAGTLLEGDVIGENAERIRFALHGAFTERRGPTLAESLYDPSIAGPEFDEVFAEIERFRHDPIMMQVRDIDLDP